MYQHKYTRRMIALGAEPDTAEVESITPHYDKLKYPGSKAASKKRVTYGVQEYPYKKSVLLGQIFFEVQRLLCSFNVDM